VFQPVFKPLIFRLKADQDASRFPVARNHDLFLLGQAQVFREIISLPRAGLVSSRTPTCASQASASALAMIAIIASAYPKSKSQERLNA
jgi:hypothetical protein